MESTNDARVALLSRLIDHAPLFPPASLDLPGAVEEDRLALAHPSSFMLARFVCPASRLSELADVGRGVSVVLDNPESGARLKPEPRVEPVETAAGENLEAALAEFEPDAFTLDSAGFTWRGRLVRADELARARGERLHSIGSCSFFEPVAELETLEILPL